MSTILRRWQYTALGDALDKSSNRYGNAREDRLCEQDWARYTKEEHALFSQLCARQAALLPDRAAQEFVHAMHRFDGSAGIPRFEQISDRLRRATGWEIVAAAGQLPESVFFNLLGKRRFPVPVWMRTPEEAEQCAEPDVFQGLFGHVPMLFDPAYADFVAAFGSRAAQADGRGSLECLMHLYWYTVEVGLILTNEGLRAFGASLVSATTELHHALTGLHPRRLPFDAMRALRTRFRVDAFQDTYFVIQSYQQLYDTLTEDFVPIYHMLKKLPTLMPNARMPAEHGYPPNPA